MEIHVAWVLVALLSGMFLAFTVSAAVAWRWVHPKPPKVVVHPAPVTVVSKPDPAVTKPQPVVKSA